MKILITNVARKKTGGKVYERMIKKALSNDFEVEHKNINVRERKFGYLKPFFILWKLFKISRKRDLNLIIKTFDTSLFLNKKPVKNIAIIHHLDYARTPSAMSFLKFFYPLLGNIICRRLKRFDAIITVSKAWKQYFENEGHKKVFLIYNAFDLTKFSFSSDEIEEFKKEYGLTEKPIVYLGNCQRGKGVVEAYEALKGLDVHLITSGEPLVDIPARNLNLSDRDYLKLLKASSIVITMSIFDEGWCRTAHEAMLCKTPIIGSGSGGMKELLNGGRQIICKNFEHLKEIVELLLDYPKIREQMGKNGYNFAKSFTLERFKKDWLELIKQYAKQ